MKSLQAQRSANSWRECGPYPLRWQIIHSNAAAAQSPGGTATPQCWHTASTKGTRAVIVNCSSSGVYARICSWYAS
eukprot:988331-Rhodomonas_salina.1